MCDDRGRVPGYKRIGVVAGEPELTPHANKYWSGSQANVAGQLGGTTLRSPRKASRKDPLVSENAPRKYQTRLQSRGEKPLPTPTRPDPPAFTVVFPGWHEILRRMGQGTTFDDLRDVVLDISIPPLPPRNEVFDMRLDIDPHDTLAQVLVPQEVDRLGNMFTVGTSSDGSCLPHVMSRFAYGHEGESDEMRVRLVVEGVLNAPAYLDHDNLLSGTYVRDGADGDQISFLRQYNLVQEYATRSSFGTEEIDYTVVENALTVFQEEMLGIAKKGMYCGIWELHIMANIFMRPVGSVYPDVDSAFDVHRHLVHRTINPFDETDQRYKSIMVMWTKSNEERSSFQHFVPLVP